HDSPEAPRESRKEAKTRDSAKVVVVASTRGGVGKSTVAYYLAGRFAADGANACFVELDIADPTVYFVDDKFRKHLQDRSKRVEGGGNPLATLWDRWLKDQKGFRKSVEKLTYTKEPAKDGSGRFGIIAAAPFGVDGQAAQLLASASSSGNHEEFLSDLIGAL